MVRWVLNYMLRLAETKNTHFSEYGSHCNELAQVRKPKLLRFLAAASLVVAAVRFLFRRSEFVSHHNERSLLCDNVTC